MDDTWREALYVHALAVASDEFEVSRGGSRGVVLTAKPGTSRCDDTLCGGAVAALQQYELTVELSSASAAAETTTAVTASEDKNYSSGGGGGEWEPRAQIVVTTRRELRSALTLRQILDDADRPDPREDIRVVALGGPHLTGTLRYSLDGGGGAGTVGMPRPELGGDSLLDYHRKRYPARRSLLQGADPTAAGVAAEHRCR